ncbi:MAG: uroporphyrinogen-III synthase, partial [Pseudomonadota bacterium]
MTLFITRPRPDAERTVVALADAGIRAESAPLMEVRNTDAALPPTTDKTVLAITSANGIRSWVARGGPALPVFAVGEASAEAARDAGFPVEGIGAGDVNALFALLQHKAAGRHILHVRGVHSIGQLNRRLKDAGHSASSVELYEAVAADTLPLPLITAIHEGGHAVGFFSPRTMRLFLQLVAAADLTSTLSNTDAICLSRAVAEAA